MANYGLQIKIQIQRNGNTKENTDMMKSKRMTGLTNGEDYLLFEYEYNWKYKYKYDINAIGNTNKMQLELEIAKYHFD